MQPSTLIAVATAPPLDDDRFRVLDPGAASSVRCGAATTLRQATGRAVLDGALGAGPLGQGERGGHGRARVVLGAGEQPGVLVEEAGADPARDEVGVAQRRDQQGRGW